MRVGVRIIIRPQEKNCPHHKIVALLSVEREWRLWVFLGIFPIYVSRYAGTSGWFCWRFFLVVIRRCLRISLHYQPMQLIGKHVRTHWRVKGTVPVEGCKWWLRKRQVFASYWGGGDDFRDDEQKRRDKKRIFVHKIKKRSGISKVKCILICMVDESPILGEEKSMQAFLIFKKKKLFPVNRITKQRRQVTGKMATMRPRGSVHKRLHCYR